MLQVRQIDVHGALAMDNPMELDASGARILEKDPGSAIDLFARALEIAPNMVPAIYNRACAFARIGKAADALRDLCTLDKLDAGLASGLREHFRSSAIPSVDIGYGYLESGDAEMARRHFEIALQYDPNCAEAQEALDKMKIA